ncbi:unnamed protein product, partial [Amoebophrya sp. A120]
GGPPLLVGSERRCARSSSKALAEAQASRCVAWSAPRMRIADPRQDSQARALILGDQVRRPAGRSGPQRPPPGIFVHGAAGRRRAAVASSQCVT